MAGAIDVSAGDQQYDRMEMLKAFDQTEAGVKGLIDSGLTKIPKIFVRPSEDLAQELTYENIQVQVPVIDLSGILDANGRKKMVEQVRIASESWGFFQVVNHGIPPTVLDGMIDGIRKFNEMDVEEKRRYYSRDPTRRVSYSSNFDLFASKTANWRDTLAISYSDLINSEELPTSCRNSTVEYSDHVKILGKTLFELLSEALGLSPDHLNNMECSKGHRFSCHYYPACPEPQLTLGATKHSDPGFLTVLLQSQISGLQVLYQDQWVNIEPIPGGLVVNIGDLLQLVSNGRFISNKHRVTANSIGPRISVACFFSGPFGEVKTYGPIKELISEEDAAKYRDLLLTEYLGKFLKTGLDDENWGIDYYKV
ncbi:1-aminocyclopropane-1-carboxylate oxidase homolog 1 [Sesamum indicum]|uniref:1-aminocyclopropane-1-carboxylate oxidase homolog 1 n=1 Tax=Sesamum indicum TaxID=4182 RepID=A0A6I9U3G7_SESIN|nr:1-aminocyclopropane-1-carboxylate oxidase homolog 1 [Sesamum indicum]